MSQPAVPPGSIGLTFELEQIQLHTTTLVAAEDEYLVTHLRNRGNRVCEHADAIEFRRSFTGFGRRSRQVMRCPSTWWQHLKLALRSKWPRLFHRLAVRFDEVTIETGALIAGLPDTVKHRKADRWTARFIIPYTVQPTSHSYTDRIDDDEEQGV